MNLNAKEEVEMRRGYAEAFARADCANDLAEQLSVIQSHLRRRGNDNFRVPVKPHSCDYCQELVLDLSCPRLKLEVHQDYHAMPKRLAFEHVTLTRIKQGAENGCTLYQFIANRLDRDDFRLQDVPDSALTCTTDIRTGPGGEYDPQTMEPFYVVDPARPGSKWASTYDGLKWEINSRNKIWSYQCVAEEQDPASTFVTSRPLNFDPSSDDSFKLIRSWRAECIHGHEQCQPFAARFRPSRLIEINKEESLTLRLVEEDQDVLVEYTTLSYCWGGPQAAQTTISNIEARRLTLAMADLPATIRDAIIVTNRLGLRYIWVDSLCILQDSLADKVRQIAAMPQIYQNSALTISTSRATYANEGFLHRRVTTDHPELSVTLPYKLPSTGEPGRVTLFRPAAELEDDNLSGRAWTLQESLLSPRVLDYAGAYTKWMCNDWHSDGSQRDAGVSQSEWLLRSSVKAMMVNKFTGKKGGTFTLTEACQLWETLVTGYTRRLLSVESDRPLAIAGLAEVCCDEFGFKHQYIAGLWRDMFPYALMWSMADSKQRLPRPSAYQGPSWSWTAVNGAVHYGLSDKLAGGSTFTIQIMDYATEPEHEEAPFGAVKSGTLVIDGRTLPAKWLRNHEIVPETQRPPFEDHIHLLECKAGLVGLVDIKIRPDAQEADWDDADKEEIDVVLFEVAYEPEQYLDFHSAMGLVLRELGDGFYSRLGTFETARGKDLDDHTYEDVEKLELWKQVRSIFEDREREVLVIV